MAIESDSFVRWQAALREQLGGATNLVLGLATGLLALQSQVLLDAKLENGCPLNLALLGVAFLGASVALAVWCAVNRLADVRLSARIARRREQGETELSELRTETDRLGARTWRLFRAQLVTFGFGAAASIAAVVLQALTPP